LESGPRRFSPGLLAERKAQLRAAAEARRAYWENQGYGQAGSLS